MSKALFATIIAVSCAAACSTPAPTRKSVEAPTPVLVDLAETSWIVRGYSNGRNVVVSVAEGSSLTAGFTSDGKIFGSAGCNTYNAGYSRDGSKIEIGPAATTMRMCAEPEGVMEQETTFLAALGSSASWESRGESLELRNADGALVLDLVPN